MTETGTAVSLALVAVLILPLAVLARRARRRPDDRRWLRLLALGIACDLAAHLLHLASDVTGRSSPHWASDLLTLAAPVLLLGGILLAMREHLHGLRLNVLLDGLGGALAGAAVAALAVMPLIAHAGGGRWSEAVLVGRPLLDAVLVSAAVGAVGLLGSHHARAYGAWAAGLVLLGAHDTIRSTTVSAGEHGAAWAGILPVLGYGLLVLGAVRRSPEQHAHVPGPRSLSVPSLASLAAVAVLTVAPDWAIAPTPSVVALLALAVCAVRFVLVFLQLHELAEIREQALTDELTGIANRRALYQHLDDLLASQGGGGPGGEEPSEFAVALIDLDHFKEVNDTLGHAVGDALLKGVTHRFATALDELETPHLLARLGGDEFAVVLHEAASRNAALIVGEALLESLSEPLDLRDAVLHAQASIGLAVAPLHGRTRGELLFAADAAMYAAKTSGDSVHFHAPRRDEKSAQLGMAEELYQALEHREIVVEYQPISTPAGEVVSAEALVRWDHPQRGRLLPGEFLEAAERYRLAGAIAERVLDVALGDLARWRAHGVPMTVTVNVGAADLRDEAIVSTVAEALLEHRVPAAALTIDVNEVDLAEGHEQARTVLQALHALGVRLALDDYGTRGTGLADLQALPFAEVKLDRRFVRDVAATPRATAVVRAVLDLVHALGLQLVAEGVEDRRALAALEQLGCDLVQGWHVGRPGTAEDIEARLPRAAGGRHRLTTSGS